MMKVKESFWRKAVLVGALGFVYAQLFAIPAVAVAFLPLSDGLKRSLWLLLTLFFIWAVVGTWIHTPDSSVPDSEDMAEVKRWFKRYPRESLGEFKKYFTW